ncbi:MAG: hypothetical protein ABR583_12695 [Gaiellaceae bacterium]
MPSSLLRGSQLRWGLPRRRSSSEEIAWGFRKLFEALARREPLVVLFDDIHWAEPTLLDLIEYVSTFAQNASLLLLCMTRPDLFELRPTWATPKPNATLVTLEPLAGSETETLVDELREVSDETKARIAEVAEGNPLFVEQLLAMQAERGETELEIPPTIQALLAARIDGLAPEERPVLQRASIEGRLFHRGSVVELQPEQERAGVGGHLLTLVRKEFIQPDRATLPGDDGFRFGHILIRDAAYDSLPKRLRAELHERFADWLELKLGANASRRSSVTTSSAPTATGSSSGPTTSMPAASPCGPEVCSRRPDVARSRAWTSQRPAPCSGARVNSCPTRTRSGRSYSRCSASRRSRPGTCRAQSRSSVTRDGQRRRQASAVSSCGRA